jgi:hypothetical protein
VSEAHATAAASAAAPAVELLSSGPDAPAIIASRVPACDWTAADRAEEVRSWLEPRLWPLPAWAGGRARRVGGLPRYDAHLAHRCRARYLALETEFRTLFAGRAVEGGGGAAAEEDAADVVAGQCAMGLLQGARRSLEQGDPDVPAVVAALDLVERCLLWATPAPLLAARVPTVRRRLEHELSAADRERIAPLLRRLGAADGARPLPPLAELRGALDEASAELHAAAAEREGVSALRLERLGALRDRALLLLGTTVALLPMLLPTRAAGGTARLTVPFVLRSVPVAASDAWLAGLAVALCGAAGGFLSGLLREPRASAGQRADVAAQQEGVLRLELRAAVGAVVAVGAFALLSWGVIPGVALTSGGAFLALAVGAGFSERYFLRWLVPAAPAAAETPRAADESRAPRSGNGQHGHGAPEGNGHAGNGHAGNGNGRGLPFNGNGGNGHGNGNGGRVAALGDKR